MIFRSRPTVNRGAATHGFTALNNRCTAVEMLALLSYLGVDGCTAWCEVLREPAWLDVVRNVARVLTTLDNKDLEGGIGCRQSACDDTGSGSA